MQTILGSGGAIGVELARSLARYTPDIRLVSRNPQKVNGGDILYPADLTDKEQVSKAVAGSSICYLTVGFNYNLKVWQQVWPELIRNVILACAEQQVKLVFFDNVYAIGGDHVKHITEQSPISPSSKKGEVRAYVDQQILEAVEKGKIDAIIARAPDFFGPIKQTSILMNMMYDNMAKGKKAQWLCNADVVHTTGYAPELAAGTAMLGNSPESYNQIWNLPVDQESITGRGWAKLFAEEMQAKEGIQVLPSWGIKLLGMFIPVVGEMYEMRYQYDRDYFFDCTKFCKAFNYHPVSNKQAVHMTVTSLQQRGPTVRK